MSTALQFISAGAGSGKTYRLTEILREELEKGDIQPQGVIATTFTVKAATELRERVRCHLLELGVFNQANSIGQARIGTVNSVCGELLERFAFENGIAPNLQVIDERQAKILMQKSLDEVLSDKNLNTMIDLAWRLGIDDWRADLLKMIMVVRSNQIDLALLPSMANENADSLLEIFGKPYAENLSDQILTAIAKAIHDLDPLVQDTTYKNTKKYFQLINNFRHMLEQNRAPWSLWIKFSKERPAKADTTKFIEEAARLAAMCTAHPRLHGDIRKYLNILFETCANIIQNYQTRKKDLGVVDFTDQEALFLEMLDNPKVTAVLSDELDLLLVDEFQDTSPIQLSLFLKLSKFAKQCHFVGDIKQAIYGFRGSSPELMQKLIQAFPRIGGTIDVLDRSWRSQLHLVQLTNEIFQHAFAKSLPQNEIVLTPQKKEKVNSTAFATWLLQGKNEDERYQALASGVQDLVFSKVTNKDSCHQPVKYGDIAILTRTNAGVEKIAKSLRLAGIPTATASAGLLNTPEAALLLECLRRVIDKNDTLATAEIISLADCTEPEVWLSNRLQYLSQGHDSKNWLESGKDAHPILERIALLRDQLEVLTPHEILRLLVMECDLSAYILSWCDSPQMARLRLANLDAIINLAEQYQDSCHSLRETVTINSFLVWLSELQETEADELAAPALDAVTIMTCHKAKGLEWPIVILTELEKPIRSAIWSISAYSKKDFKIENLLHGRSIRYWPWPFGNQLTGIDILETIEATEEYQDSLTSAVEEGKRLLYVGMTRPKDMLILAQNPKARSQDQWVKTLEADWLFSINQEEDHLALPSGTTIPAQHFDLVAEEKTDIKSKVPVDLAWFKTAQTNSEHLSMFLAPSDFKARRAEILHQDKVGTPIRTNTNKNLDWSIVGQALHTCLAASFTDLLVPIDEQEIQEIFRGYGLGELFSVSEIKAQIDSLHIWIKSKWAQAEMRAEVPVTYEVKGGQYLQGWIDLLLETPEGYIIIDHKSSLGTSERLEKIAQVYSGQLDAYALGVEGVTNKKVLEKWLFLPIMGKAICIN